ncbi:outer membrane beta-barrel protein [Roseibium sediminis]|uniref:outer membrane beta-barrel protein n=1 Tax=Roseibium sediminis TaxID=1775174 RepID=UPI00123E2015|nr:outer membrane beta-barrel protein [Roseibium sediminis]
MATKTLVRTGILAALITAAVAGGTAAAEPAEQGWFADIGAGASFRSATSDTKNGGASFTGTVSDVKFDTALTVGGRVGYQFSSALGVFMSYDYVGGDVRWFAAFPRASQRARFDGEAQSHVILANVSYSMDVSSSTSVSAIAGLGLSINRLSDIDESPETTRVAYATVDSHTQTGFAARGGVEVSHALTEAFELKLGANLDYYGKFRTGDSRQFGTTTQAIGAYELGNAWGGSLMARATYRF